MKKNISFSYAGNGVTEQKEGSHLEGKMIGQEEDETARKGLQ